jgi:excisionase family DNA binding protein
MKQQKITQVHHVNQEDLLQSLLTGVEEKLNSFKENFQPKKPTIWISRKDVGEILSISLVSVDIWTKKGILTAYRIGNKKRFKRNEVESALTKINH